MLLAGFLTKSLYGLQLFPLNIRLPGIVSVLIDGNRHIAIIAGVYFGTILVMLSPVALLKEQFHLSISQNFYAVMERIIRLDRRTAERPAGIIDFKIADGLRPGVGDRHVDPARATADKKNRQHKNQYAQP